MRHEPAASSGAPYRGCDVWAAVEREICLLLLGRSAGPYAMRGDDLGERICSGRDQSGIGATHYLDRQDVDCGGSPISKFQMRTLSDFTKISFGVQCSDGVSLDVVEVSKP